MQACLVAAGAAAGAALLEASAERAEVLEGVRRGTTFLGLACAFLGASSLEPSSFQATPPAMAAPAATRPSTRPPLEPPLLEPLFDMLEEGLGGLGGWGAAGERASSEEE